MRWSDLDSGFRRNDDMPTLALIGINPLSSFGIEDSARVWEGMNLSPKCEPLNL
jgi:hypothetical protein